MIENTKKNEISLEGIYFIIDTLLTRYIGKCNTKQTRANLTEDIISELGHYFTTADNFDPVVFPYPSDLTGKINYGTISVRLFKDGDPF